MDTNKKIENRSRKFNEFIAKELKDMYSKQKPEDNDLIPCELFEEFQLTIKD